jgi:PAS domain S-box-containing protein
MVDEPPSTAPALAEELAGLRAENARLARELEAARSGRPTGDVDRFFRLFFELAPFGAVLIKDGENRLANKAFTEITGYERDDVPTSAIWFEKAFPDPAMRQEFWKGWSQNATATRLAPRILPVTCKDGRIRQLEFRAVNLGYGLFVTTMLDITERLADERARRLFDGFFRHAGLGLAIIGPDGEPAAYNRAYTRLTGYEPEDIPSTEAWFARAFPDPELRRGMLESWADMLKSEGLGQRRMAVTCADGAVREFETTAAVVPGSGALLALVPRDLDPEAGLRASNEQLRGVLEHSPTAIWATDLAGRFELVNPEAARLLGVTAEEATGLELAEAFGREAGRELTAMLGLTGGAGRPLSRELTLTTAAGPGGYRVTLFPLRNPGGWPWAVGGIAADLSEHRRAEAYQHLFQGFFDHAPFGTVLLENGEPVLANRAFTETTGYTLTDIPSAMAWFDQVYPDPAVRASAMAAWEEASRENGLNRTFPVVCKDGRSRQLEMRAVFLEDGRALLTMLDVTDRLRAEAELQASRERFELAMEATSDGLWDWDLTTDAAFLSPRCATMLGFEPGELYHDFSGFLTYLHPEDRAETEARVLAHCEGRTEGYEAEFRMRSRDGTWRWLLARGRVVARDAAGRPLRMVGTHADITARHVAEVALRETLSRLQAILDHSPSAICMLDAGDRVVLSSHTCGAITGRRAEDMLGRRLGEVLDPQGAERMRGVFRAVRTTGRPRNVELRMSLGGSERTFLATCFPLADPDGSFGPVGVIASDVTELTLAASALRASQERFALAMEASSDGLWDWDRAAETDYFGPGCYTMLGYAPNEFPPAYAAWLALVHPEDRVRFGPVAEAIGSGRTEAFEIELRLRGRDGGWHWVLGRGRVVARGPDGRVRRAVGTLKDIAERKAAEAALKASEERYALVLEATSDGLWDWDVPSDRMFLSPRFAELMGYRHEDLPPTLADLAGLYVHPDDRAGFEARISAHLGGLSEVFEAEFRVRAAGGGLRHVLARGRLMSRDASGRPLRMAGTVHDVTEGKAAKERLRETLARLQGILDHSPAAIYIWDREDRLIMASRVFLDGLGGTAETVIGKTAAELFDPETAAWIVSTNQAVLRSGQPDVMEEDIPLPDGTRTLITSLFPLKDEAGRVYAVGGISTDITARKRAEDALQGALARLQGILDHSPSGIYVTAPDGRILLANAQAARLIGRRSEEIEGRAPDEIMPPERAARFTAGIREAAAGGRVMEKELVFDGPGVRRSYLRTLFPLIGQDGAVYGVGGIITDISERKAAEDALTRAGQHLRDLFDALPVLIHAHAADGTYAFWNKESERVTGYPAATIVGNPEADRLLYPDPGYRALMRENIMSMFHSDNQSEASLTTADGRSVDILWMRVPVPRGFDGLDLWEAGVDISRRKRTEAALTRAKEAAEAASRAKTEFLAAMSHEIRTPMNSILGMADLLSESELSGEQRRFVEILRSSGENLLCLLNDILDLSKIEAGRVELEHAPFCVSGLAQAALGLIAPKAAAKGLGLGFAAAPELPELVLGDAARLRQILANLLDNAVKFTERGEVRIALAASGERLRLAVSDTGIGIPEDKQALIFERFTQADSSTTRRYGGTGLGLAISRRLAEMMGGRIELESEPGRGSTFCLDLPLSLPEAQPKAPSPAAAAPAAGAAPARVLLVEDNESNWLLFELYLKGSPHTCRLALCGEEALEILAAERFDLVFMDIEMPGLGGLETTRRLRAMEGLRGAARTPVVALSAHVLAPEREAARAAGMDDFLAKPFSRAELLSAIERQTGGGNRA